MPQSPPYATPQITAHLRRRGRHGDSFRRRSVLRKVAWQTYRVPLDSVEKRAIVNISVRLPSHVSAEADPLTDRRPGIDRAQAAAVGGALDRGARQARHRLPARGLLRRLRCGRSERRGLRHRLPDRLTSRAPGEPRRFVGAIFTIALRLRSPRRVVALGGERVRTLFARLRNQQASRRGINIGEPTVIRRPCGEQTGARIGGANGVN